MMGRPKLTMPWRDSTVIEQVLAAWKASRVSHLIVVVRPDDQDLVDACRRSGIEPVIPGKSPPEMKVSVAIGLNHVQQVYEPSDDDSWLLAPADMPDLSPKVIDRLLEEHESGAASILVPVNAGRRGHPVLFHWTVAEQVHTLGQDEGVNALLSRNPVRKIAVTDQAIIDDLDTPEDYMRLRDA